MMNSLDDFFKNFVLRLSEKYPTDSKIYLYADYFELICLFNNEDVITPAEMLDRLTDEGLLKQVDNSEDQAEDNDRNESFVRQVFILLTQRFYSFENDYPFNVRNEELTLKKELSDKQKLYIFLLLSSNLNLFKPFQPDLTTEFELISEEALKNYLPNAQIKNFGKNTQYRGYTQDKIRALASDMNLSVDEGYIQTIASKGTQDLGLDIVGWIPLVDTIGNYIAIFGQCACGKDWNKKLSETRRYNKLLEIYLSEIIHSLFIPYSLINYNKSNFYEHHEFGESILLFERKRILSLVSNIDIFNSLKSKNLVEYCINYQESIV
ncbi:hypothetical protein [Capnocytophaga canimorsus]|uniref:hypothetical protein n=1 Tax=Capnocytophaga canimorsus TaxID=28188 RepID=UPI000D6DEDE4|nr:hypothetical protein [Capnocytophaga canimorsus]AWL79418.1 hypothetical protein DKB58_10960 [Capnocytophaga canimorsus]AYW35995.1 hypothetical protein D8L92_00670 [Capnocytophaga canimorsus]